GRAGGPGGGGPWGGAPRKPGNCSRMIPAEEDTVRHSPTLLSAVLAFPLAAPGAARAAGTSLTLDALLDIRHPSSPAFSPDGRRLAFVWERAGVQNLFVVDGIDAEPRPPRAVTPFTAGGVEPPSLSPDNRKLLFVRDGDLGSVAADGGAAPAAVWTTKEAEGDVALSPDGTRVAFVRSTRAGIPEWQRTEGAVFVRPLAGGPEQRVSAGDGVASSPSWSPDGRRIVYTVTPAAPPSAPPD